MTLFFETILKMSIGAGVLALLIICIRSFVGRKLAILMPLMCAVLIAKLIIPLSIPSPLSVQNIFAAQDPQTAIELLETNGSQTETYTNDSVVINETDTPNFLQNQPAAETTNISVLQNTQPAWQPSAMDIAALIWMIGVVVLTIFVAISNIRFGRMLRRNRPYTAPRFHTLLAECKRTYNINKHLSVIRVSGINTAAVYGIFRPKLLISPDTFNALSMEEKRHILMHELAHIKSRDTLTCLILTIVNIVHWFNPLVWIAFIMMRQDLEVICDAHVIKKIGNSEKHSYASTLISLLKTPSARPLPLVTALFIQKNSIKRRIRMISRYKKRPPLYTALALVLTIIVAVTGCTTAVENTELVTQADTAEVQPDGTTEPADENTTEIVPDAEGVIAKYVCDYSAFSDNAELSNNIKKAVNLLDGTVIAGDDHIDAPDDFDFMALFTPITTENGWETAPGIFWNVHSNGWKAAEGIISGDITYGMHVGGGIDLVMYALIQAAEIANFDQITCGGVNSSSADFAACSIGISNHQYETDVIIHADTTGSSIVIELCGAPFSEQTSEENTVQPELIVSFPLDYNIHKGASNFSNVEKAAALLDSTVIAPAQELSLNEILGPRTEASGWKAAPGIAAGAFVMQPGGGVSAVSNALYNAAIRAELNVVDYSHHSIPSAYVPCGLDATISTDGPDLKIANPYDIDVTIQCRFEDGIVTIDVYGPPLGYTVDFTSKRVGTEAMPETIYYYDTETAPDGTPIAPGQSLEYIKARQSPTYEVYKTKYDADGNEIETILFETCTYRGRQGVVYVNSPDPS